jgi:hypothetical protein
LGKRLGRLEERAPKGCPTCRTWSGVVFEDGDGRPPRPELCPASGWRVPAWLVRRYLLVRWDEV